MTTRHLVLAGAGLVGAATMATSAVSLYDLGIQAGIGNYLAAALPVALDVGAGVAALAWLTETGPARTWGRATALAALAGSLVGNGLQHALHLKLMTATLPLVLLVGASIPAMLFAVIHLAALMARPNPSDDATATTYPAISTTGGDQPEPATEPAEVATVGEHVASLHILPPPPDRATELIRSGIGRKRLARELDITEHEARQMIEAVRRLG